MGTASELEREIQCPTSSVLSPIVRESGEDAERGNVIHVFCRSVIAGTPRALALAAVPPGEWRETCEHIDVGVLCSGLLRVRAEVAYRIDIEHDTVIELGVNLGRRYPPRAANDIDSIDGTNDFEGFSITGMPVVTDIKTGFWPVTACRDNPQMKFHARALMLKHDVGQVRARIAYIAVDGQITFDEHVFTRIELDIFNDELAVRRDKIARANAALRGGGQVEVHADERWCRYCPAKVVCPKFTSLARAMLGELRDVEAKWPTLSLEERAKAFLLAAEAKDIAERVVDAMKGIARTQPIDLGGGKVLRETASGVRVVNAEKPTTRRRKVA